jgi:hypothetical protein
MNDNKCYSEEFIKLLQNSYNEFCKVILKNSKNFYIIDMIECYRIYDSIFTYEQPYKQKYKLFIVSLW